MIGAADRPRRPLLFIAMVFVLSVPFYWLNGLPPPPNSLHIYAPAFIFASVIPVFLANLLLYQERGWGAVGGLWLSVFDVRRIRNARWYAPVFLLTPAIMAATFFISPLIGKPIHDPQFPIKIAPLLFVAFVVEAIGEEAGWSGYVIEGLQARWTALTSALVLGLAWAAWHVIPFLQAHHASNTWVLWQCAGTVLLRVLMVWIFNNTGRSVLAMVLFHAMINESEFMYPNLGSFYDPFIPFLALAAVAAVVVHLWGARTLARFRGGRSGRAAADGV
jgi:membrane protease YdiL (CAAX protease family)